MCLQVMHSRSQNVFTGGTEEASDVTESTYCLTVFVQQSLRVKQTSFSLCVDPHQTMRVDNQTLCWLLHTGHNEVLFLLNGWEVKNHRAWLVTSCRPVIPTISDTIISFHEV